MIITFIIALICVLLDQLTKQLIMHTIEYKSYITVIKGFFTLTYIKNDGVAFSFNFTENRIVNLIIMTVISLGALIGFIYIAVKTTKKNEKVWWLRISLGLLIGGDLGNIIDRSFYSDHMVTDFLSFTLYYPWFENGKLIIASSDFAVFNLADSFIVVGVIMFLIYILFLNRNFFIKPDETGPDEVIKVDLNE